MLEGMMIFDLVSGNTCPNWYAHSKPDAFPPKKNLVFSLNVAPASAICLQSKVLGSAKNQLCWEKFGNRVLPIRLDLITWFLRKNR